MMAVRSSRFSSRFSSQGGLFLKLAGLLIGLLPLGARAEVSATVAPAAAAVTPPGSASALDPESVLPGLLAAGRCDDALKTLGSLDASQRHAHEMLWFCRTYHQCSEPRDALAACSVAAQSDALSPTERAEAQSYGELALSQYQQSPTYAPAPAAVPSVPELPGLPPAPPPQLVPNLRAAAEPVWEGQSRFYFRARPLWTLFSITGGLLVDVGFEHIFKSGLLLGGEVTPAAIVVPVLGAHGQVRLGYGSRKFTIGVAGGGGVFYSISSGNGPLYQPRAGLFFRAGRLDRTYVEFALNLAFFKIGQGSAMIPIPFDGVLHISTKTAENWRFKMDIGGTYYLFGPYLLFGGERRLASSARVHTALNFGVGLVFPIAAAGLPGPLLSIGYEKRF